MTPARTAVTSRRGVRSPAGWPTVLVTVLVAMLGFPELTGCAPRGADTPVNSGTPTSAIQPDPAGTTTRTLISGGRQRT